MIRRSECRGSLGLLAAMLSAALPFGAPVLVGDARAQATTAPQSQTISKEKLEQLVAPIALYPDALLSQVLMASTYPLEVVQAARWVKSNSKVTGKALENAMQSQTWDASVKSLTAFPTVLQMMSDKLDWTQQLGDAFLAQQKDTMAAVQSLRLRADKAGTLKSTKEQKVSKTTTGSTTYIVVEPASPTVVYVPAYNPTVVYGTWPYPAYPPYYYYPPGYAASSAFWFATGVAAGAALWGNCNWGRYEVNVNVNRYNEFNRTNISNTNWQHQVEHRKGVPYTNKQVANQYRSSSQATAAAASREQFRGRAEAERAELKTPATRDAARQAAEPQRTQQGSGKASGAQREATQGAQQQRSKSAERSQVSPKKSSAFDVGGSGASARAEGNRGSASRTASGASHGGISRGGGGGGGRGGGGGGGGRR